MEQPQFTVSDRVCAWIPSAGQAAVFVWSAKVCALLFITTEKGSVFLVENSISINTD